MDYLSLGIGCETITVSIPTGSILFDSTPPGAEIYLIASGGGAPVDTILQTPNTIPNLPVGNYDYILKLAGFEDYKDILTVNENEITTVIVDLVPIPSIDPVVAAVSGVSIMGLLLAATTKSVVPLTTGKLGGEIVSIKL